MPHNITDKQVLLVGAGGMAQEYAKVLQALGMHFTVVGRGEGSATTFGNATGVDVIRGGLAAYLGQAQRLPFSGAIVAVPVDELAAVTIGLLEKGILDILVEKPVGVSGEEIEEVARRTAVSKARVYVAYNRRHYASVLKGLEIIAEDGGVTSFHFEFTEWSHVIEGLDMSQKVKNSWFLANSTHVVDMAFFLGGRPKTISSFVGGGLPWHPSGSVFAGSGITEEGALFSYHANWQAPGRWGVEVMTKAHRLIFRPLEKLQIQNVGSIEIAEVPIDNSLDIRFKPGLYRQTGLFLSGNEEGLLAIEQHMKNLHHYRLMLPKGF